MNYLNDDGYAFHRRHDRGSRCLTFDDWRNGRSATGYTDRYRWVEPNRDNRTKEEWPYSYSDHYLWGAPGKDHHAVYSDRLGQWDGDAWKRACAAVPKKSLSQFSQSDADKFMSAYYGKPIKVSALAEGCNVSSGYPYWILWFAE